MEKFYKQNYNVSFFITSRFKFYLKAKPVFLIKWGLSAGKNMAGLDDKKSFQLLTQQQL